MVSSSAKLLILASVLLLLSVVIAGSHDEARSDRAGLRHAALAERQSGQKRAVDRRAFVGEMLQSHQLSKRFGPSRVTYYATGGAPGACGTVHQDSEWTNSAQFGDGSICGQVISLSYNGKTGSAPVYDSCPTCDFGMIDLSPSFFQHFASFDEGMILGTWTFDESAAHTTSSTPLPPSSTLASPASTSMQILSASSSTLASVPEASKSSTALSSNSALSSSAALPSSSAGASATAVGSAFVPAASSSSSVASTAPGLPASNNLEKFASLVNGLGTIVCGGNVRCGDLDGLVGA